MNPNNQNSSEQIRHILELASNLGEHLNVTHWAVSAKVAPKSDQIQRLKDGRDLNTRTAERIIKTFGNIWPEDLEWPENVPRPKRPKKSAA